MVVKGCCPFFGIQMGKRRWYFCSPGRCHSQIGHWKFMTLLRNKLVPSFHTNLTWLWDSWNPFKSSIYFSNSVCFLALSWLHTGCTKIKQGRPFPMISTPRTFVGKPPLPISSQPPPLSADHQKQTCPVPPIQRCFQRLWCQWRHNLGQVES